MKTVFKRVMSTVLALVMIVSVFSSSLMAFAESEKEETVPEWQTYLTDGKALKTYLEENFLNLTQADKLFLTNSESISQSLCAELGDLFMQMGYAKEDYPKTQKELTLCLARVLSSLEPSLFYDPDRIETVDVSLIYNLAYIGGTDYIEKINSALPEELRFDTSSPVISLSDSQKQVVSEYYAKWKTGALRLSGFDFTKYLGSLSENEFLKDVLLVLIADNNRLPAIIKSATGVELSTEMKCSLASAVADIMDNLATAPVSALLRQLSDTDFQSVLRLVLETAGKVTVSTDYYAYKLYTEGIYTDTDGSAIEYIKDNGDGTYSYNGPTLVSSFDGFIDSLLEFLDGLYAELNKSVLDSVFNAKFSEFQQVIYKAVDVAQDLIASRQKKLNSDITCAEIEIRYANAQIEKLQNGTGSAEEIAKLNEKIDELSANISAKQEEVSALEDTVAVKKDGIKGYYDVMADLNSQIETAKETADQSLKDYNSAAALYEDIKNTDEADYSGDYATDLQTALEKMNSAKADYDTAQAAAESKESTIKASNDYVTAKAKIDALDVSLADTYSAISLKKSEIKEYSSQVDDAETQIKSLKNGEGVTAKVSIWQAAVKKAQAVIDAGNTELKDLPSGELINYAKNTISGLLVNFFGAFDGVYKQFLSVPITAAVTLLSNLSEFAETVDKIDWDYLAPVTDELFAELDGYIDTAAGRYLGENGGVNIIADLSQYVNELLESYGILQFTNITYLDKFIADNILADNSDILQTAAGSLKEMFPNIEPTYESIITCIVPLLSSFNFGTIMENVSDLSALLPYASPLAFSYLAGMGDSSYFETLNSNIPSSISGGKDLIKPVITLSTAQQTSLKKYADMEKAGSTLKDISAAGFVWSDYLGGANMLDVADMLVKIDFADSAKLGDIASAPGVGEALMDLLFGLIPEAKTEPVTTIIKRISNPSITSIVDFALSLMNGADNSYKSYDLFFTQNVYYDKDGNPAFYAALKDGNIEYNGPTALSDYAGLIAAGIDFAGGLYGDITSTENNGDLLKAILIMRSSQLKNLLLSSQDLVISLLYNTADYNHADNYIKCMDLLSGLLQNRINTANEKIEESNTQISVWQSYLEQVKPLSDSAKLAKAKEFGLFDESVTSFDESALTLAVSAKTEELKGKHTSAQSELTTAQADLVSLNALKKSAADALDEFSAWQDSFYDDPFYSDLEAILSEQDSSLIDVLREDCAEDIDSHMGEGTFDTLCEFISDNMADYEGDPDTFIDDYIFNDGINTYSQADKLDAESVKATENAENCEKNISSLNALVSSLDSQITDLETGAVVSAINQAGDTVTIHISDASINAEGDFNAKAIDESILTIRNEDIADLQAEIAGYETEIASCEAEKNEQKLILGKYNVPQIDAVKSAFPQIAEALASLVSGSDADGSKNIYHYIVSGNILGILLDSGRIETIHSLLNAVYEPVVEELVSREVLNREVADKIILMKPAADTFYEDYVSAFPEAFSANPVNAAADLIGGVYNLFVTVYNSFSDMEDLPADVLQSKKIADDVSLIFDTSFKSDWADSYTKCAVMRIKEVYNLIEDILGLSVIKNLIPEVKKSGTVKGKLQTAGLFGDLSVSLVQNGEVVSTVSVSGSGDGSYEFTEVPAGIYSLKVSASGATSFTVNGVSVNENAVTDLTQSADESIGNIKISLGDVDADGTVGVSDVAVILLNENYGQLLSEGTNSPCDLNGDRAITVGDVSIILMAENYGKVSSSVDFQ